MLDKIFWCDFFFYFPFYSYHINNYQDSFFFK